MSSERREAVDVYQSVLKVRESVAEQLFDDGFVNLEEIAYCPHVEVLELSGMSEKEAKRIRSAARQYLIDIAVKREEELIAEAKRRKKGK